jgi:predicted nuclease of restriction endonuclease-like RecB superfamily
MTNKKFTKSRLEKEYIKISVCDIAKKYNISTTNMYRIFEKLKIKRRKCNSPGILASRFTHLKSSRFIKKLCSRCGKELSSNPKAKHCIKCHNYLNSINKKRLNKVSKAMLIGWKTKGFAKKMHSKRIKYKGIYMRSSWEVAYAKYLDKQGIKWQYEPKTFDLGKTTYTPDFYLPDSDTYVEIKGYFRNKAKIKISLFRKIYKNFNLKILKKSQLIKMEVLK